MNNTEQYQSFALCREMLETIKVIRNFALPQLDAYLETAGKFQDIFLTGEGSSRIFPAKRAIAQSLENPGDKRFFTEGSTQALAYDLRQYCIFGSSNSGRTRELIRLFSALKKGGHKGLLGITAAEKSPLEDLCQKTHILSCGRENAVAATKSVAEQALFYDALAAGLKGKELSGLHELADALDQSLKMTIDGEIIQLLTSAQMVYFAGRNDGVAEELTLKTNEIIRKKADFLEGSYGAHGIEEVMSSDDVLVVVEPFAEEEEKFRQCLTEGAGVKIIAISSRQTSFDHNIVVPRIGTFQNYVELAAGWNLLVEAGLSLHINLDKALRARKVGNEYR